MDDIMYVCMYIYFLLGIGVGGGEFKILEWRN